jgi:lipoprotein-anchoring transpeptidase ErfK/SrfK
MPMSHTRVGAGRRPWSQARVSALGLLLCLCCVTSLAGTVANADARPPTPGLTSQVDSEQRLAVLGYEHRAYREPSKASRLVASVAAHRPITGEMTTLPVLAQATSHHRQRWLKVMLPGRPNGSTGWIKRAGTHQQFTSWFIHVSLAARRVWVYHDGALTRSFSGVVGKPSTPTPTGRFFVEETVIMPTREPGGPFALALSARSDVFHEFDGGPGQIAIHGRDGLGGTPGQAQSHGCVRLTTPNIDWLAARITPGTPVTITKLPRPTIRTLVP